MGVKFTLEEILEAASDVSGFSVDQIRGDYSTLGSTQSGVVFWRKIVIGEAVDRGITMHDLSDGLERTVASLYQYRRQVRSWSHDNTNPNHSAWASANARLLLAIHDRREASTKELKATLPQDNSVCTDKDAIWCPLCGSCSCPRKKGGNNCPLHSPESFHGTSKLLREQMTIGLRDLKSELKEFELPPPPPVPPMMQRNREERKQVQAKTETFVVTGTSPELRRRYRQFRAANIERDEALLLCVGMVLADSQLGSVRVVEVE